MSGAAMTADSDLCLVCETPSAGSHGGLQCCRACNAFFRRTVQLQLKYICRFNRNCDVTKKNRYSCRFCRYQACVAVGMRGDKRDLLPDEGVFGDCELGVVRPTPMICDDITPPSMDFGIVGGPSTLSPLCASVTTVSAPSSAHSSGLLVPSSTSAFSPPMLQSDFDSIPHPQPCTSTMVLDYDKKQHSVPSDSFALCGLHSQMKNFLKTNLDYHFAKMQPIKNHSLPFPLAITQQALLAYQEHNTKWPKCNKESVVPGENVIDLDLLVRHHYIEIEFVAQFCMTIVPFAHLPPSQKKLIYRRFWPHFHQLDRCHMTCQILGYDTTNDCEVSYGGTVMSMDSPVKNLDRLSDLSREEVMAFCVSSQTKYRDNFVLPFKRMRPDEYEFANMLMSMMWNVKEIPGIHPETIAIAEQVRCRLSDELHNYYLYDKKLVNYVDRVYKMCRLMSALNTLQDVRKEDIEYNKIFNIFKEDIFLCDL